MSMQRWEERKRQKVHQSRVQNAKSTFNRQSKSREKQVLSSSRSKVLSHTPFRPTLPFLRILEIFQLEQYSNLLHFYGFPQKLTYKSSLEDNDEMLSKVDIDDRDRFISLLNTLSLMSKSMTRQHKNTLSIKRNSMTSKSQKSHLPPSSSKASSTINKTQKHNLQQQCQSKFRIRNKPTPKKQEPIERRSVEKKMRFTRDLLDTKRPGIMARDDLHITQNYKNKRKGQPTLIDHSNTIVQKLFNKLKCEDIHHYRNRESPRNSQDLDLEIKKIKEMYLSFDSGTLTSNITNIDIEEIINCLTLQIFDLLKKSEQFLQQKSIVNVKKKEIQKLLKQSFVVVKQQSKDSSRNHNEQPTIIPQRLETPERRDRVLSEHSQQAVSINDKTISVESDSSDSFENFNYFDSFASDFCCFDSRFQQSIYGHKPTKEDIKNFIQLVMMAGRMEKEIPIIAHVYLKRLLKSARGGRLTDSNWRNIILVVLIEGSKIWDDQSLQNNSFAKVIKPYTTLQINRLEKYLLAFIDYTLTIGQKEYSQSYFQLRRHAKEANKTANLVKLDLKTIKKLQAGAKKGEGKLKDFYSKCMNKSF